MLSECDWPVRKVPDIKKLGVGGNGLSRHLPRGVALCRSYHRRMGLRSTSHLLAGC